MQPIIYFDICSIVIYLLIILTMILKKTTQGSENKTFLVLLYVSFISTILSLATTVFSIGGSEYIQLRYLLHTLYLVIRNFIGCSYVVYIIAVSDTWHKFMRSRLLSVLLLLPFGMALLFSLINIYSHNVFYISQAGEYTHGQLFCIYYISAFFYAVFGSAYLYLSRKYIRLDKRIALYSYVVISAVALLVQHINSNLIVEMFANAICLLMIIVTVQRPEDVLDAETGLKRYSAYSVETQRNFDSDKKFDVIIINVNNYSTLLSMYGFEAEKELLRKISDDIRHLCEEYTTEFFAYYLDGGRFRVELCERYRLYTFKIAYALAETFRQEIRFHQTEINFDTLTCIIRCPSDVSDYHTYMLLDNKIDNLIKETGTVTAIAQIDNQETVYLNTELDNIIEDALNNQKFEVYYQPIYSVKEKKFCSAEALLRLKHEKYGFISPEYFIPAAENNGSIYRIGEFVLESVCQFIASDDFKKLGVDYIEVNLSVAQCMQTGLAQKVIEIIEKYGVKPNQINLEITETAASFAQNVMMDNLNELTENGIKFSLDDYGTGYSNIKRVASLPLKLVKIDKSFTNISSERLWIVLKNTINMLKEMDMQIVVEGVETKELVNMFSELDCEFIQGYYFSKPLPRDKFVDFIEKNKNN